MPEETIVISINEDGKITAKTGGFKGEACLDILEELLDAEMMINIKKTDEYHQGKKQTTTNKQRW